MTSIAISEFRANMSAVIEKVQQGEVIRLTQRGLEVAKLVPPDLLRESALKELQTLQTTAIIGDVVSPLEADWDTTNAD